MLPVCLPVCPPPPPDSGAKVSVQDTERLLSGFRAELQKQLMASNAGVASPDHVPADGRRDSLPADGGWRRPSQSLGLRLDSVGWRSPHCCSGTNGPIRSQLGPDSSDETNDRVKDLLEAWGAGLTVFPVSLVTHGFLRTPEEVLLSRPGLRKIWDQLWPRYSCWVWFSV